MSGEYVIPPITSHFGVSINISKNKGYRENMLHYTYYQLDTNREKMKQKIFNAILIFVQ